jgi:DNA invertase Pin-like site-specific DNA recombinase
MRKAREWAERNGFTIHEQHRFVDEAISGTKNCRPGLDQMLAVAECGEFDILLVESLSRLARSHVYASTVMMHLVYVLKIRIIGIDDGCDTSHSGWELLAGIFCQVG